MLETTETATGQTPRGGDPSTQSPDPVSLTGTQLRFGHAVRYQQDAARVMAWGACDAAMAWRLRECLDGVAAQGHRRVTLDLGEMRFVEFTAVAVLSGALTRAVRDGIEMAIEPPRSASGQILRKAHFRSSAREPLVAKGRREEP